MKKIIFVAAAVILVGVAVIVVLARNMSLKPVATAVVLDVTEGIDGWHTLNLFATPGDNSSGDLMTAGINSGTRLTDSRGKSISITDIQPGQLVSLTYSGSIQETYPAAYADVYSVKVLGPADDALYALAKERQEEWNNQLADMRP